MADALAAELRARLETAGGGRVDQHAVNRLVQTCRRWGIAPDVPLSAVADGTTPGQIGLRRLVAVARQALLSLEERLARAPADETKVRSLGRDDLLAAIVSLVSPTGQLAITGTLPASARRARKRARGGGALDAEWLTWLPRSTPRLAALELHQLTEARPFAAWSNRPTDPWQRHDTDQRRFVAVYAAPGLNRHRCIERWQDRGRR